MTLEELEKQRAQPKPQEQQPAPKPSYTLSQLEEARKGGKAMPPRRGPGLRQRYEDMPWQAKAAILGVPFLAAAPWARGRIRSVLDRYKTPELKVEPPPAPPPAAPPPPAEKGAGIPWPSTVTPPEPTTMDLAKRFQQGIVEGIFQKEARKPVEKAGLPYPHQIPKSSDAKLETFKTPPSTPPPRPAEPSGTWVPTKEGMEPPRPTPDGTINYGGGGGNIHNPGPQPGEPPNQPPHEYAWGRTKRLMQRITDAIPQEHFIWSRAPKSRVIGSVEGHSVNIANSLDGLFKQGWVKEIQRLDPQQWVQYEWEAVQKYHALVAEGHTQERAVDLAIENIPNDSFRKMMRYRAERIKVDNQAKGDLGLEFIKEVMYPYLPRLTNRDYARLTHQGKQFSGLALDLQETEKVFQLSGYNPNIQTTVKSFEESRHWETIIEGQVKGGVDYQDPRLAWIMREWYSIKLEHTARLIKDLQGKGVLYDTREAVKAAHPEGEPFEITGIPGKQKSYWTPSRVEAKFLEQNLSSPGFGFSGAVHLANQLFRNPNLYNPLPHFLKNMLFKYNLAAFGQGYLPRVPLIDMMEFVRGQSPLVAQFKQLMPFTETGKTADQMIAEMIQKGPVSSTVRYVGMINQPSSKFIFSYADPALRYSLWKKYVRKGFAPQEAANHVWVDLIRYGTRSQVTDAWKHVPFNFFVPWRTGSLTAVTKQMYLHPMRATAYIGAIDYLREAHYRQTGRWTHLPIDYIEGPLAGMLEKRSPGAISAYVATTAILGPGGNPNNLQAILDTMRGKGEWENVKRMLWGISNIFGLQEEFKKGNYVNIIMAIAVSEHERMKNPPKRLMQFMPEWMPGMRYKPSVRAAEKAAKQ